MAKEDFCFTYYDGDAARDMAHMNRLERGAYTDIIISQRKFGRLSLDQIKKILGKDFSDCWGAIELVMKFENDKYYVEWVAASISKMKKHSGHQKENGENGGRPPKEFYEFKKRIDENIKTIDFDFEIGFCVKEQRQCEINDKSFRYWGHCIKYLTQMKPNQNPNDENKKPLGNGNEDGDGNEKENGDFEKSEKLLIPEMLKMFKTSNPSYPSDKNRDSKPLQSIAIFICDARKIPYNPRDNTCKKNIYESWNIISEFVSHDQFFKNYSLSQVEKHIQSIAQSITHGTGKNGKSGPGKINGQQIHEAFAKFYKN